MLLVGLVIVMAKDSIVNELITNPAFFTQLRLLLSKESQYNARAIVFLSETIIAAR